MVTEERNKNLGALSVSESLYQIYKLQDYHTGAYNKHRSIWPSTRDVSQFEKTYKLITATKPHSFNAADVIGRFLWIRFCCVSRLLESQGNTSRYVLENPALVSHSIRKTCH